VADAYLLARLSTLSGQIREIEIHCERVPPPADLDPSWSVWAVLLDGSALPVSPFVRSLADSEPTLTRVRVRQQQHHHSAQVARVDLGPSLLATPTSR